MERLSSWGAFFAYVEADVVVPDIEPCWLEQMTTLMRQNPTMAMLGSAIDKRDFIDLDRAKALKGSFRWKQVRALIKADSPERDQNVADAKGEALFRPHNPAGRLMMIRTEALRHLGAGTDTELDKKFRNAGYDTAVASTVVHRHLSLLNLYDYQSYDMAKRDEYMASLDD